VKQKFLAGFSREVRADRAHPREGMEAIDTSYLIGLRDRALIGVRAFFIHIKLFLTGALP
jgi:hypothetical protein